MVLTKKIPNHQAEGKKKNNKKGNAHMQHNDERKGKNEMSALCVILCCVRITRTRHGLRGKGLTDTQDITRHELE